jgi:hypothetical protein
MYSRIRFCCVKRLEINQKIENYSQRTVNICKLGHGETDNMYLHRKTECPHTYLSDNMV